VAEAERLINAFGVDRDSTILDIGFGVGRLATGLFARLGEMSGYRGLDVSREAIEWCQRFISADHPGFDFTFVDVENPRYNPRGRPVGRSFTLPVADRSVDVAYLYSVFSHMGADDVRIYVSEIARVLTADGHAFLTAFVERDVPDVTTNPEGYRREWVGELHCVRFEHAFFERLVTEAGLGVDSVDYATETDGQSGIYVSRR
jgi:SAM-dependent methyltransferase